MKKLTIALLVLGLIGAAEAGPQASKAWTKRYVKRKLAPIEANVEILGDDVQTLDERVTELEMGAGKRTAHSVRVTTVKEPGESGEYANYWLKCPEGQYVDHHFIAGGPGVALNTFNEILGIQNVALGTRDVEGEMRNEPPYPYPEEALLRVFVGVANGSVWKDLRVTATHRFTIWCEPIPQ